MSDPNLESLARQAALGDKAAAEAFFHRLREVLQLLQGDLLERAARLALFVKAQVDGTPTSAPEGEPANFQAKTKISPELREWACQQFSEEELIANLREAREKGGLELKDFIHELEALVQHP